MKEEKKELSRDDKKRLMKQRKDMIKNGTYIHTLYYTTTTNSPVCMYVGEDTYEIDQMLGL